MAFLFNVKTPAPPQLPAPRRVHKEHIANWLALQCTCGDTTGDTCYADYDLMTEFDAEQNYAYKARVLFKAELKGDEKPGSAYQRWAATCAERGKDAQQAYDDFLFGLEVAGMSEHMARDTLAPKSMTDEEAREILSELTGKKWPEGGDPKKDLIALAQWERAIKLRRTAPLRRRWFTELQERAFSILELGQVEWKDKKLDRPFIRNNTFKLLVRKAEVDFDPVKFLLLCLTLFTFVFSFYTQITNIIELCSGPFLCPSDPALWKHRPVIAPPVAQRVNEGFQKTSNAYNRHLTAACEFGTRTQSGECASPGYKIEWPYMQTANGASDIPEGLKAKCEKKNAGTDGYVYDYFQGALKTEYWQCPTGSVAFKEGGTPFHYESGWYKAAHSATLECMDVANPDRATWEQGIADFDLGDLELCFLNHPLFQTSSGLCDCKMNNARFDLRYVNDDNINKHQLYGCFFTAPAAAARVGIEYQACTATPAPAVKVGALSRAKYRDEVTRIANLPFGREVGEARDQTASLGASRKTALLIFFILKEGGPFITVVGVTAVSLIFAALLPFLSLIVNVVAEFMSGPAKVQFKAHLWNLFEELYSELTNAIWSLSMGASITFRSWDILRKLLFNNQCNASLVKDGINKITGILNIMFNLMVLVFAEITFTDQAALWISIILSVFNLTIQILLEKEKQKFITSLFKDINENRLSKFELALGLVKCMEDFLEDDVQFNFVQHFQGTARVRPKCLDEYDDMEKKKKGAFDEIYDKYDKEQEREFANGEWREIACCGHIQDDTNPTIFSFYPLLPQDLKEKFGSDGKYEWASEQKSIGMSASAVFAEPKPVVSAMPVTMAQYPPMQNGMVPPGYFNHFGGFPQGGFPQGHQGFSGPFPPFPGQV